MKVLILCFLIPILCISQKYKALDGEVSFFSSAPLEDITAFSNDLQGIVDGETGEFFFRISIRSFNFKRPLMQAHFNDKYMESDIYPVSIFKGTSSDLKNIQLQLENSSSKQGSIFPISGKLSIHGVEKDVLIYLLIARKQSEMIFSSEFFIKTDDFKIKIPKILKDNISEKIQIKVSGSLKRF